MRVPVQGDVWQTHYFLKNSNIERRGFSVMPISLKSEGYMNCTERTFLESLFQHSLCSNQHLQITYPPIIFLNLQLSENPSYFRLTNSFQCMALFLARNNGIMQQLRNHCI